MLTWYHCEGIQKKSGIRRNAGVNVDRDIVETVLSPDLNSPEPKLARQGYRIAVLCDLLNARRSEVRSYMRGQLAAGKTEEFNKEIHKLGIL